MQVRHIPSLQIQVSWVSPVKDYSMNLTFNGRNSVRFISRVSVLKLYVFPYSTVPLRVWKVSDLEM